MKAPAAHATDTSSVTRAVARIAAEQGVAAYLVGGAVRDALLGRAPRDLDVALELDAGRLARFLAALGRTEGLAPRARHERFGTATLGTADGFRLDVAATRRESYPSPAALPVVTTGVPILEDLARRDFTVHAMARRLGSDGAPGPLVDPHEGAADLSAGVLRLLHDRSLVDDPTRVFRAARYASRLGFAVAREFAGQWSLCREAGALAALSADRLRRALGELLEEETASQALDMVAGWGVLAELSGGWRELRGDSVAGARGVEERWRALFAPLAADDRRDLAVRLNFSRALRKVVGLRP